MASGSPSGGVRRLIRGLAARAGLAPVCGSGEPNRDLTAVVVFETDDVVFVQTVAELDLDAASLSVFGILAPTAVPPRQRRGGAAVRYL